MRILIILAHPDRHSFNHAIANECKQRLIENGHDVILHDLHGENFDPVLTTSEIPRNGKISNIIKNHCDDLVQSDGIIIVHPNWWGQPPAILKGWIDRILRPGIAYEFLEGDSGEGIPVGLLKAKTGLVINTSNTNADRENNIFGDPLESIWKNCIFDLIGVKQFERKIFRIIVTSDIDQRLQWLNETRAFVDKHFPKEAGGDVNGMTK